MNKPNIENHNPDPQYLRGLIDKTGLSQRECARRLGISPRALRQYITHEYNSSYEPVPYTTQYGLEGLANG